MRAVTPEVVAQKIGDTIWTAKQLVGGLARSALPIQAHVELMRWRARLHCRLRKVPDGIRENLASAFGDELPPSEIERLTHRYVEFSRFMDLLATLPFHLGFRESGCWEVEGSEYLDEALSKGRGAILAVGHFGFNRLMGHVLGASGYDILTVTGQRDKYASRLERLKTPLTRSFKGRLVSPLVFPANPTTRVGLDIRPIFDALSQNKVVKIAADGTRSLQFVMLDFIGKKWPYPTGFLSIAAQSGANVLPAYAVDGKPGDICKVVVLPALQADPASEAMEALEEYARAFDSQVRQAPHLWHNWRFEDVFQRAMDYQASDRGWTIGFGKWCNDLLQTRKRRR